MLWHYTNSSTFALLISDYSYEIPCMSIDFLCSNVPPIIPSGLRGVTLNDKHENSQFSSRGHIQVNFWSQDFVTNSKLSCRANDLV